MKPETEIIGENSPSIYGVLLQQRVSLFAMNYFLDSPNLSWLVNLSSTPCIM